MKRSGKTIIEPRSLLGLIGRSVTRTPDSPQPSKEVVVIFIFTVPVNCNRKGKPLRVLHNTSLTLGQSGHDSKPAYCPSYTGADLGIL